jgi:hypothetical protein
MIFTSEPLDFLLVKKARLALQAEGEPKGLKKFKVPGSKHVLSECEGSRSVAGSGQALNF